jgi:hypothetical protein
MNKFFITIMFFFGGGFGGKSPAIVAFSNQKAKERRGSVAWSYGSAN